jgi:adenosine deaminase
MKGGKLMNEQFIKQLPKAELHFHLDGSIRPETLKELAKKEGIELANKDLEEFKKYVQVGENTKSLIEYLEKFNIPLKVINNKENLKRITKEIIEDASKQNIKYLEIRFAPLFDITKDITGNEKVQAVLDGMKEGLREFGVHSGLILCAMRHESLEKAKDVINIADKFKNKGVVAVDLAGNEKDFPPKLFKEAFDLAHSKKINITIHAGETGSYQNVLDSINILHAKRIGHGVAAAKDPKTMGFLKNKKIPLEICVKSNIDTKVTDSYEHHPIKVLLKNGVKVTLNTDNTTVSNITLNQEYGRLAKIGFTKKDLVEISKNGVNASFAPEKVKKMINQEIDRVNKFYGEKDKKMEKNITKII